MSAASRQPVDSFDAFVLWWPRWRFVVVSILAATGGLMFLEWVWKLPFLYGFPGLYWLFVAADAAILPLIGVAAVAAVVFLVLSLVQFVRHQWTGFLLLGLAGVCLGASLGLATTLIVIVAQHTVHMDSQRVRQHVYYLADYPFFAESNYRLYECDFIGLVCQSVYYSGDVFGSDSWPGALSYTADTNELVITTGEHTKLFTYSPP